jgi:hypothetical protein
MAKISFFGVAATTACVLLAVPALGQQRTDPAIKVSAQRVACAPHNMGNPYNRETDYWDWSAWQARGGWDARNDFKCTPNGTGR